MQRHRWRTRLRLCAAPSKGAGDCFGGGLGGGIGQGHELGNRIGHGGGRRARTVAAAARRLPRLGAAGQQLPGDNLDAVDEEHHAGHRSTSTVPQLMKSIMRATVRRMQMLR
jgi:hypothetical protein